MTFCRASNECHSLHSSKNASRALRQWTNRKYEKVFMSSCAHKRSRRSISERPTYGSWEPWKHSRVPRRYAPAPWGTTSLTTQGRNSRGRPLTGRPLEPVAPFATRRDPTESATCRKFVCAVPARPPYAGRPSLRLLRTQR